MLSKTFTKPLYWNVCNAFSEPVLVSWLVLYFHYFCETLADNVKTGVKRDGVNNRRKKKSTNIWNNSQLSLLDPKKKF